MTNIASGGGRGKGECDVSEAKRRKTFSKEGVINHIRISSSWQVTYTHFHCGVRVFVPGQQVSPPQPSHIIEIDFPEFFGEKYPVPLLGLEGEPVIISWCEKLGQEFRVFYDHA